ncbi:tannase/feruloyl esterase family alpha/beta hydrolase [Xanthobacter autotrophicus]|uniref:tannase/feruloyl esterase family alpha/beta hydrolase n=1 Tax=Xanthobacter autotrophicus TaxID=280 RepID=UPI003726CDE1
MTARTLAALAILSGVAMASGAKAAPEAVAADPHERSCSELLRLTIPDATVISATLVEAGRFTPPPVSFAPDLAERAAKMPAFCRVEVRAAPTPNSSIGIEVWLPIHDWNGRFLGTGNGGGAGSIAYGMGMIEGLRRGFAVANSDLGTAPDINETIGNPERWTDFGHRATHEMTRVAKQVVRAFFGPTDFRSYFEGCSTGGQQALSVAQRYPNDYDGVLVGDPGNNRTHVHASFLWAFNALNETPASRLTDANLSMISKAVIASCGGKDGGAPGDAFLTDPRRCRFDPETLTKCEPGAEGDNCLTAPQLTALRKLYLGAVNPRTGERIYPPLTLGSENQSLGPSLQGDPRVWPAQQFYPFKWAFGADFDPRSFDFDHDLDRLDAVLSSRLNANSPDMSDFRRRGGKVMLYTGLADPAVPFEEVVTYYERVIAGRGDLALTQDFFRLFLVPGMGHCFGGLGATDFGQPFSSMMPGEPQSDSLMSLVRWVETGAAPDRIIGTRYGGDATGTRIEAQRPICAYPQLPRYVGGDPAMAMNYRCVESERGGPMKPSSRYLN